jgi:hypothetical protein
MKVPSKRALRALDILLRVGDLMLHMTGEEAQRKPEGWLEDRQEGWREGLLMGRRGVLREGRQEGRREGC